MIDAEMIANQGKQNDVYLLNSNRPKLVRYMVFDILRLQKEDLRNRPFEERLRILGRLLKERAQENLLPATTIVNATTPTGVLNAKETAVSWGFEGVVVKSLRGYYRDNAWLKLKKQLTADVVILGVNRTKAFEQYAIAETFKYGHWDPEQGKFAEDGSVSAGLQKSVKASIGRIAVNHPKETTKETIYIEPKIVIEVDYTGVTPGGTFREPRIKRIRPDKQPADCLKTW